MDDNNEEQKSFSPIQSSSYNYSESSKKSSLPIFSTHTPGIFGSARGIFVDIALSRANTLLDDNIYDNIHKQNEFRKQTILGDESLTTDEKTEAIKLLAKYYDKEKVLYNEGTRRICESCNQECLAALYCEYCVKNYLKANFLNWTSGNYDIDNLIQKCQSETLSPDKIIEWIPYHNLKNIKYLTKGGFSEIYIADWIGGHFYEWDSVKQQLKRIGTHKVILKKLENIESADQSWFNEVKYHLTLSNKYDFIVRCFGLTQNPSNGNYVLVMRQLDMDLRKYLQQNHNKLTWKERIQITVNIIKALVSIHKENLIHRDLHSGNILYDCYTNSWFIGNFGFCGPADNKLIIIYGNLPYMAPEVISGKTYISFASDIYSIAMLMWEISSGQAPIINFKHDYNLVMNIVNGMRPKVIPGTPIEYKNLMKQCWDADPLERPDINALWKKINDLSLFYQSKPNELIQNSSLEIDNLETVTTSKLLFTSKVHQFENLPEPKNATEEEQEETKKFFTIIKTNLTDIHIITENATEEEQKAFYNCNVYDFSIPDNIDFTSSSNENSNNVLELSNVLKDEIYNCSNPYSKRQGKCHNSDDNNSEVNNSIFWSDALEVRLCELYMKNDVIDIFWGRPVEEHLKGSTNWNIYVITHGLYCSYANIERIADGQVIHFIAEETKFVISNDPLPSSIQIPQELRENFDEALDNELGLLFREAHYNLVGIGTGYKQIRGQFTEEPAIIFYVRQKGILRRGCSGLLPKEIRGFPTDVIEACVATPCNSFEAVYCRSYQQDVKLGSSIGIMGSNETRNTTGTLSAIAYENNSPNQIGIISCEHVLKFNESNPEKNITIYQPSYNDQFEPRRRLRELLELSKELGENEYIKDISIMRVKLNIAESQNSKLATYVKGMRKNFLSKIDNKYYGVDAGFCVFDNKSRKLCSKNFPIPSSYFKKAGLSTCLESTYTYCELKNFNHKKNRVFKVGRTTGLTLGELLPTEQAIACTIESIKNAKRLEMEKHIPCYNNEDQKIFIGYMKSQLDSEIRQKRKKCYPIEWFDRQLAFKFESGDFDCGDSGASIIDETGKALGILHAKWITPCQTFGIASPYFAILEALDVSIQLSSDPVTPTVISSSSNIQNNYKKVQDVKQTTNSQKNQSKIYLDQYCSYYYNITPSNLSNSTNYISKISRLTFSLTFPKLISTFIN